jgi:RsiW-degrading membrane proteinase PrsW (M82 family)
MSLIGLVLTPIGCFYFFCRGVGGYPPNPPTKKISRVLQHNPYGVKVAAFIFFVGLLIFFATLTPLRSIPSEATPIPAALGWGLLRKGRGL